MRWTSEEIDKIRIDRFLEACGYEFVGAEKSFVIYNVPEVTVDGSHDVYANPYNNYWYGARYGERGSEYGQLRDIVGRIIHTDDIRKQDDYIRQAVTNVRPDFLQAPCLDIEALNRHKQLSVELSQYSFNHKREPSIITVDIMHIRLTDFMKTLGQDKPVATEGDLRLYHAPYNKKSYPTMVIDTNKNKWHDTESGASGGIYDLACEITHSCNVSELTQFIAAQMGVSDRNLDRQIKTEHRQEPSKQEPDKPKRRMRL